MESPLMSKFLPALVFAIAFLSGSIPFGNLLGRLFGRTSRGAWIPPVLVAVLDVFKGAVAVFLMQSVGFEFLSGLAGSEVASPGVAAEWAAAFFAVTGHCFSPWLHFKGGRGVAPMFGALILLSPVAAAAGLVVFGVTMLTKRSVQLASIASVVVAGVTHMVFGRPGTYLIVGAAMLFLVLARHEKDMDALLDDREKAV